LAIKAYISISYNKRKSAEHVVNVISETLRKHNIIPFVFVDNYQFNVIQEREMMVQAMADIDGCDILIAETSDKAIGIGVETGYAKAKGKTVVYVRHKDAEHSTTISGMSDYKIIYGDLDELTLALSHAIAKLLNQLLITTTNEVR
jgi:2'-deoxynucleoside 5'-phosphate N-hydrolase